MVCIVIESKLVVGVSLQPRNDLQKQNKATPPDCQTWVEVGGSLSKHMSWSE